MNNEMMGSIVKHATYTLKEGRTTSYIDTSGWGPLPKLISFCIGVEVSHVARTGRGLLPKVGQMKAQFTKGEESPYKQYPPYKVQTSIWRVANTRSYYYGTLGVSNRAGKIGRDNGDMMILHTTDWRRVDAYIFVGLAADKERLPKNLADAVAYLKTINGLGAYEGR